MDEHFLRQLYQRHQECPECPPPEAVAEFFGMLLGVLFPDHAVRSFDSFARFDLHVLNLKEALYEMLYLRPNREDLHSTNKAEAFFQRVPVVFELLKQDIEALYAGDPAAQSEREVVRSYPGFYAVAAYRFAHELQQLGVKVIPRMLTEHAHSKTGIDIHPAARIGSHFCIDHGTGVVIGATCEIGNHVKLYQGVTLGALSVDKLDAAIKRHPTIEGHVVIYAGSTILGGKTVIGHHSIIGGNTWVTRSVPAYTKVYYTPTAIDANGTQSDGVTYKKVP
jgi:serine O-acetyltransferase